MTEQEIQELYEKCSYPVPGSESIRAIDFRVFKVAADIISHHSFKEGLEAGFTAMDNAVNSALNIVHT